MKNYYLLMEENKEGAAAGGGANDGTVTPSGYEAKPETNPPSTPPNETAGDQFDEFGYKKLPETKAPEKETAKPADAGKEKIEEKVEVEKPATGYEAAPEPAKEPDKPADPPAEEKKLEYELDVKGVNDKEAEKLKKFALDNKLPKEAAQALVNLKKSELADVLKAQQDYENQVKREIVETKAKWYNELKADPQFGGEKFDHNVHQVNRLMQQFMGETKKVLTERGGMLPPHVMRDLSKLASHLYGTEKLVTGEEKVAEKQSKEEDKGNDPLAFYT